MPAAIPLRRLVPAIVVMASGVVLVAIAAPQQTPPQEPPPTFRAGVDVIQMDVSVLDKDRRPVHGLTARNFKVVENGKVQQIVTVTPIEAADRDPPRSARMRYVSNDVAMNDLADALGDGRLFAIVFDDRYLPGDDTDILVRTREAARHAIEQMGPSDMAAVVYSQEAGKTQDFTSDREKLLAAIDRFGPKPPAYVGPTPLWNPPPEGDMQRFSSLLMRSQCAREEPSIPTLEAVVARMASVAKRRKSLLFLSIGVPLTFGGRGCNLTLSEMMKDVFRRAQAANVNIHTVDPTGYDGYVDYIRTHPVRRGLEMGMPANRRVPGLAQLGGYVRFLHEFLLNTAESTGGRAIIDTDAIQTGIEEIFDEDGSFYLLGYQSTNGSPDGRFRKVEVSVDRPGLTVRTRTGYWARTKDAAANAGDRPADAARDLAMAGMEGGVGLALRATVAAIGAPRTPGGLIDVAVALSVRLPPLRTATAETLTLTRNIYDANGRASPPEQEVVRLTVQPGGGDEVRYEVLRRLALAPGRYQVRYSARSAVMDRIGTVYADLEVPDVARAPLSLSNIVLGRQPDPGAARDDVLAPLVPIMPTTARDFLPSDDIAAFARVYQGGTSPIVPVSVVVEISDAQDAVVYTNAIGLDPAAFGEDRSAPVELDVPLERLSHGPFLLTVTARTPGRSARREVLFEMQ
jgi:VWFA-related protein